jgi:hypothetical protein
MPDGDVILPGDPRYRGDRSSPGTGIVDPATPFQYSGGNGSDGQLPIRIDTGDVKITIGAPAIRGTGTQNDSEEFGENLAEYLDDTTLGMLANEAIQGVEDDITSRAEWIREYSAGVDLLGTKVEEEGRGGDRRRNVSRVGIETLTEAMLKYQAAAEGEMLPASGPAKVPTIGRASSEEEQRAQDFQDDFNFLLTDVLKEYYPDTGSMLMHQAFCGLGYKKIFRDPIRNRPTSQSIIAPNLIVSEEATDLDTAIRVTHEIEMTRSTLRRMQICNHYLDIPLGMPSGIEGIGRQAQRKIKENQGIMQVPTRPQDTPYLIWEVDTDIDPLEFGIHGKFEREGPQDMPLPYKITVDRASGKCLGVWRNWRPEDKLRLKRNMYVKFELVRSLGYHSWGFLHLLGNQTRALRALRRIMINAGMFSQFPGGMKAKNARTSTTEVAPGPGEWIDVDAVMGPNFDISKLFMAMPYKDVSAALFQLYQDIKNDAKSLAGTAQIEIGEGRTNVPMGTVMAMVEQQVQVMSSIHKRNHQAQKQELVLLRELFAEDVDSLNAFCRLRPRPGDQEPRIWTAIEEFMDLDLQPASDPNVPSFVHRLMVGNVAVTLAQQAPQYIDVPSVLRTAFKTIGLDPDVYVTAAAGTPPPQPPPDPMVAAQQAAVQQKAEAAQQTAQIKAQELQQKQEEAQLDASTKAQQIAQKQQEAELDAQGGAAELQVKREGLALDAQAAAAHNETQRLVEQARAQSDLVQLHHQADRDQGLQQQKTEGDIAAIHHQADRDQTAAPQWFEPTQQQGLAG